MNNRIKNICSWLTDNRDHVVLEQVRTSEEDVLSETGRCVKYAFELVEFLIPSPIVQGQASDTGAANEAEPASETRSEIQQQAVSDCMHRLDGASSFPTDQTGLTDTLNPLDLEIPLSMFNDGKPFSCGGVIRPASIGALFMDYYPDWDVKIREFLIEAQNRGLVNEDDLEIIYHPFSISSYVGETEKIADKDS